MLVILGKDFLVPRPAARPFVLFEVIQYDIAYAPPLIYSCLKTIELKLIKPLVFLPLYGKYRWLRNNLSDTTKKSELSYK